MYRPFLLRIWRYEWYNEVKEEMYYQVNSQGAITYLNMRNPIVLIGDFFNYLLSYITI